MAHTYAVRTSKSLNMSRALLSIGALQILVLVVALARAKVLSLLVGPTGFGIVSTVDQTVVTVVQLGALSLPLTGMKVMSFRYGEGAEAFQQEFSTFFRAILVLAAAATAGGYALFVWQPAIFGQDLVALRPYLAVAMLGVPTAMLSILFVHTLAAAQRGGASAVLNLLVLFALAISSIAGVLVGGILGLYIATFLAGLVVAVATLAYLRRELGLDPGRASKSMRAELRSNPEIVRYSLLLYSALAVYSLMMLAMRYFVFNELGASAAGRLQALLGVALTVAAALNAMSSLHFAPLVNRKAPTDEKVAAANDFAAKILILLMVGGLTVTLFPRFVLTVLFSSEFALAATALYAFVLWQCLHQVSNVYLQLLIGLDDVGSYALITSAGYGCAALLLPVLITRFGILGAAFALSAGMLIATVAAVARLRVRFGAALDGIVALRTLLCLAAVAGAGMVFAPSSEGSMAGIAQRSAYVVAVFGMLALTLTAEERRLPKTVWAWLGFARQ